MRIVALWVYNVGMLKVLKFAGLNIKKLLSRYSREEKPFVYVAMGDSSVEGIGATHPSRSVPGIIFSTILLSRKSAVFHNLGKNRASTVDVLENQLQKAIGYDPDLITISIGVNDMRKGITPRRFSKHLSDIVRELKKKTHAEIVINSIPDISFMPIVPRLVKGLSSVMVKRMNTVIERIARDENLTFIDMYHFSRIYGKSHPEIVSSDGIHPSDFGYALWANTILSHIAHILTPNKSVEIKMPVNLQRQS